MSEKYYIVRGEKSGVFFGKIKERRGREVTLSEVRRLWYWDGAASISQIAKKVSKNPRTANLSVTLDEIVLMDVIEIDLCTDDSVKNIQEVAEWKM